MKLLFLAVFLLHAIGPAGSLKCFQCGLSTSLCFFKATCDSDEKCFTRNRTALGLTVYSSGCTSEERCGKVYTDSLAGVEYRMTTFCCDTDLCNGAATAQLSLLAGSLVALAWLTGLL